MDDRIAELERETERLKYENDVREVARLRYENERRALRHGVPALISFFVPGVGQLVKGHFLKGIFVWVGLGVSAVLMTAGIGFVTFPLIWIWQLYDAYKSPD